MQPGIFTYWKLHRIPILLICFSCIGYFIFAYYLQRTDTLELIFLYGLLFVLTYKLIQFEKWNFKLLTVAGILMRLVFLLALPSLSQDFYRFIWDGALIVNGINPFLHIPDALMEQNDLVFPGITEIYEGMGGLSSRHYSNYPPVNQWFFALGYYLGGPEISGTLIIFRVFIIAADLGIVYWGRKILKICNQSVHLIFWYFLNPLVIIELTGNLHFEGVMICFFLMAVFLISSKKWIAGALPYAFSIGLKLVPLMVLPLVLQYLKPRRAFFFYIAVGLFLMAIILTFYHPTFAHNYSDTLKLWFSNFEFNAGIFNVISFIAEEQGAKPWEFIKSYGKILPVLVIILVLLLTLRKWKNPTRGFLKASFIVLCFYFFFTPTVHPWYIIFPLTLSLFTRFRFMIIWSFTILLSYAAYANPDNRENNWILFLEYIPVFGYLGYEMLKKLPYLLSDVKK